MTSSKDEQERLRRMRDQQIYTRDPQRKVRRTQSEIAGRYRTKKQQEKFLKDAYKSVPYKWKGLVVGGLLGLLGFFAAPMFLEGSLGSIVGLVALVVFALLGLIFGISFDWREEMRDFMKK